MEMEEILEQIMQADMVLVGLGEEFDEEKRLREDAVYRQGCENLRAAGCHWLIPAWNEYCSAGRGEDAVAQAIRKLMGLLVHKNFFIVSVSTNSAIAQSVDREDRLVTPCGGVLKKQCGKNCGSEPMPVSDNDRETLDKMFGKLYQDHVIEEMPQLGKCAECGYDMVLNNIYTENYDERGYLDNWQLYTKWLQGTLNKKVLVLELGVGMKYPGVIRWPFEKVITYNQKAFLYRINEKIYQLPQEISTKGCGISQNAIAWLGQL